MKSPFYEIGERVRAELMSQRFYSFASIFSGHPQRRPQKREGKRTEDSEEVQVGSSVAPTVACQISLLNGFDTFYLDPSCLFKAYTLAIRIM